LLWKEKLESEAEGLAIAPPSKDHPAEIGVATGSHLVRYSPSGSLLGDAPLEGAGLHFLGGADLDGDGKNEWIMAQSNAVFVLDAAGEEYWMHIGTGDLVRVEGIMDLNQDGSREIVLRDGASIVAKRSLPGILWRTPALDSLQSVVPDPSGVLLAQTRDGIRRLGTSGLFRGAPLKVRDGEILKGRLARKDGGTLDVFGADDDTAVDVSHDLDGDGRSDILVTSKGVVAAYTQDGSPLLVLAIANNWGTLRVAMEDLDGRPGDELVMAVPKYGLVALGISPQATKP